jgi:sigma-E factor negative regulatory protein RseB
MIDIPFVCRGLLVVLLAVPVAVVADTDGLLARIQQASRSLDYDGIFVYQRGDQLDSLRVVHKASAAGVRERLVSLNGAPREIIRSDREVQC